MKKRLFVFLIVGLVLTAMGIAATARAATTLANVAAYKTTEGTEAYTVPPDPPPYPTGNGNDESRYFTFTHGDETYDSYWRVDLGAEYTVDYVDIQARSDQYGVWAARINGATLQGYAADGTTTVGPAIVLSGFTAEPPNPVDRLTFDNSGVGWAGVQWFQIGGSGISVPYLHIGEFQALAEVTTYPNFITGITATATNVYAPVTNLDPANLVNNSGMDDQGAGVGNPAALHRDVYGDALWHTTYNPTEDPIVTFHLGAKYDLTDMVIWNEHQTGADSGRCIAESLIEYSTDGENWTALADTNEFDPNGYTQGNYTLHEYDTVGDSPPWPASDTIDLDAEAVDARYVEILSRVVYGAVGGFFLRRRLWVV